MIKIDKILVPTDFSEHGRCALQYGATLAERFNSEVHLLNVLEDMPDTMAGGPGVIFASSADFLVELKSNSQKALDQLAEAEPLAGKRVVRVVREGKPFVEIIRYAREADVDLIVLSTHGRSAIIHVLMGSVAERVVRKAGCPVLTVRPEGHQFVMP